jgi:carbonic anhydrase
MPNPLQRLINGFTTFRETYFEADRSLFERLSKEGQKPEVLVVACSDSRVDPAILTHSEPGDLFVVRNVAAIVPPYEPDGRRHSTSAALEFGVRGLEVGHIVVLGHALCAGVRAAVEGADADAGDFEFVAAWVRTIAPAVSEAATALGEAPPEVRRRASEQAGVVLSLRNLWSFPWVRERVEEGRLSLHGWYFDLTTGELLVYDAEGCRFVAAGGHARPLPRHSHAATCGGADGTAFDVRRFVSGQRERHR